MFESLKNELISEDVSVKASMILSEMSDGGALEDDILDNIVIPQEEISKLEALLQKIPDDAIGSSDELTDKALNDEVDGMPDPTLEELLGGDDDF